MSNVTYIISSSDKFEFCDTVTKLRVLINFKFVLFCHYSLFNISISCYVNIENMADVLNFPLIQQESSIIAKGIVAQLLENKVVG